MQQWIYAKRPEAKIGPWVSSGAILSLESRMNGFERLPDALASLFTGGNTGKMVVER
jgi:NADPH-dependent curcumin reductase CurA